MNEMNRGDLIYDWNLQGKPLSKPDRKIQFDDETLRDGLQSPSVRDPNIKEKIKILHLMEAIGIDSPDIGLPGAGPRAVADVTALAKEIADKKMNIKPNCAARTMKRDIDPIVDISQKVGLPIEICTFVGSSPIRQYTEGWDIDKLLHLTDEAVRHAVNTGLPVMYVTEDTTRAHPEDIKKMYTTAIECGAKSICVCDTVGHITPEGVKALITYIKQIVEDTGEDVRIDWHGHSDRGLGVPNSIAAIEAGATRVHACALGIGERVGNTPMDVLLVNLKLMGWIDQDLTKLKAYCETVSRATGVAIPDNYPVIGKDAFRTATGVHAAAVIKAFNKNDRWLADRVYSGVPAEMFGSEQIVEIGYMSGKSNVIYWLNKRNIEPKEALVEEIFNLAKQSTKLLTDDEILELVRNFD